MSKKVILIVMDGWGLGQVASADAIQHADVPFTKSLYEKYPHTTLITCGEAVGLPEGQMGNSEVGHLNLGAGRIVYQELQRINVGFSRAKRLLIVVGNEKHFSHKPEYQQAIQNQQKGDITFSPQVLSKYVFPQLSEEVPTFLLVIDNLRYDQWKVLEPIFNQYFNLLSEDVYFSILL